MTTRPTLDGLFDMTCIDKLVVIRARPTPGAPWGNGRELRHDFRPLIAVQETGFEGRPRRIRLQVKGDKTVVAKVIAKVPRCKLVLAFRWTPDNPLLGEERLGVAHRLAWGFQLIGGDQIEAVAAHRLNPLPPNNQERPRRSSARHSGRVEPARRAAAGGSGSSGT